MNVVDKVIKALEDADVTDGVIKMSNQFRDVLVALLKEQEPKLVIRKQGRHENSDGSIDYFALWYCPHCNKLLQRGFCAPWIEHCYKCGKAVKWEK